MHSESARSAKVNDFVRALSYLTDPRLLVFPVVFITSLTDTEDILGAFGWTLVTLTLAVFPILAFVAWHVHKGDFSDNQVIDQIQRNHVYFVGNLSLLITLVVLSISFAPRMLITLVGAMFATGTLAALLNQYSKISVHTGAVAGAVVSLLAVIGYPAVPAVALILVVGWTRLVLRRHSLAQVVAGAIVGGGITTIIFWLRAFV